MLISWKIRAALSQIAQRGFDNRRGDPLSIDPLLDQIE
jgi:hypothetical protein